MASKTASKINAQARGKALTALEGAHRFQFSVLSMGHRQAGSLAPRSHARAELARLYPEEYRRFYLEAKAAIRA
jgi:hypothetical protein